MESNIDVQNIVSRISKLNKKEKLHILNILKIHQKDYTKNAYGYFFNLSTIEHDVLKKVCKCLELIETNRDLIWEMDKRRDDVLVYYKSLIEDKLKTTIAEKYSKYLDLLRIHPMNSDLDISFRRVIKIKKRIIYDEDVDPDELMKEYTKSMKYPKNSVHHRILACCKSIKSKNRTRKISDDDDTTQSIQINDSSEAVDAYSEGNMSVASDTEDVGTDSHSLKDSNESESIEGSDTDNDIEDDQTEPDQTEPDKSIDEQTQETRTERSSKKKEKKEEKMSFYRRLLNMKGFEFDKTSVLKLEDYIQ